MSPNGSPVVNHVLPSLLKASPGPIGTWRCQQSADGADAALTDLPMRRNLAQDPSYGSGCLDRLRTSPKHTKGSDKKPSTTSMVAGKPSHPGTPVHPTGQEWGDHEKTHQGYCSVGRMTPHSRERERRNWGEGGERWVKERKNK